VAAIQIYQRLENAEFCFVKQWATMGNYLLWPFLVKGLKNPVSTA